MTEKKRKKGREVTEDFVEAQLETPAGSRGERRRDKHKNSQTRVTMFWKGKIWKKVGRVIKVNEKITKNPLTEQEGSEREKTEERERQKQLN